MDVELKDKREKECMIRAVNIGKAENNLQNDRKRKIVGKKDPVIILQLKNQKFMKKGNTQRREKILKYIKNMF